jgi:glycosyltransferase involved in cell wall biosynthesis
VLYSGSLFNRRHVPDLIRAFARVAAERPAARLIIVGDDRSHPPQPLEPLIASLGLSPQVTLRRYVPDEELAQLYRRARVFAFLSEYEGFGFTPLEALQAGVPIVVADTPVAREIYGEAAVFVKVGDVAGCAVALARLLDDEGAREGVLARAPAVLARYSWEKAAAETLRAIEHAV